VASAAKRTSDAQRAGQRSRRRAATLIAYFDTSALIKTVLKEDGSQLADELWSRSSSRFASRLVYPEGRAALAAAQRAGRIDERAQRTAARDLEAACTSMALIGVDWVLAQRAGEIAERYALRGYDAVHLATALDAQGPDLVLVTWDRDLALAATTAGLAVVPR
jgi:predicted nucleic acid-binding protein